MHHRPCGAGSGGPPHCNYTAAQGALYAGNDVRPAASMTPAEARAACDALAACEGLTFEGSEAHCSASRCMTYFKSSVAANGDVDWTTLFKAQAGDRWPNAHGRDEGS